MSVVIDILLATNNRASSHRFSLWLFMDLFVLTCLSIYFYFILNSKRQRLLILTLYCIYLIFFVILLKLNSDEYKSTSNAIGSLMVLTLSIYYLINFSVKSTGSESIMSPNFLIVVALMLNVSSTLFVSLISNNLTESELSKYWYITNIAVIGTNILISIAFVMQKYRKIPSPNGNQNVDFTFPDDR